MMEYKGYKAQIKYDNEARIFHGEVLGIRDVITFQGTCVGELETAFIDSVDDYLDFCRERGEKPDKPFSGKFMLRINPEIHQQISQRSKEEEKSMNEWISEVINHALTH